jgi:hypothetical protein
MMKSLLLLMLMFFGLFAPGCFRNELDDAQTFQSTFTNFSSEIVMDSYATIQRDGHTTMVVTWRAPFDRPRDAYIVFVHAIDKKGNILFQFDHKLLNSAKMPTNLWGQERVIDVFSLTPPTSFARGKYTLRIGLFVHPGGRQLRLFATDLPRPTDGWKDVAVLLTDVACR